VQGRLRNEVISAEIETVCAQSSRPLVITLDSKMKFRIKQKEAKPLVFSPQVDWASFSEPNIIQSF